MRALGPFVCIFCALGVATFCARGNPLGGTVVPGSGAATISSSLGTLTIDQTTPRVIINWRDFSINPGEITRFVQPSAGAAALNRVITANPSQIHGTLQGNGAVFLINQNGILVGPSAQIHVGTFLASTLDFGPDEQSANGSFLAGAGLRLSGNSTAVVRNEGYISALDDVFLIAHSVQNAGTISGHTVGLAAGADIELRQAGTERLAVLAGNSKAQPGATDGVVNSGNIAAVTAELKAAGGNIYALAINNGGAIRATGIVKENGRILLRADRGTVVNSGTLDASSRTPGSKGGDVKVLGERVGLVGNSKIDASGDAGGGTVLVGGDFQGKNADVPNAQRTLVGRGTTINADALSSGDGGKVIVWSDEATRYLGEISARGAGSKGNGGFVEVSGKANLAFDGAVNVAAAGRGARGTVLLDPRTITVQAAGPDLDGDGTPGDNIAGDLNAADFPGADSIITAGAVNGLLTGNNTLILAATERTTVNAAIDGSDNASLRLEAPRVDLNAPITLAGSGVLSGTPNLVNVGMFGATQGTIQNAVDVAVADGTVNVAAGSYAENISVTKGLTLRGAQAGISATTRDTSTGESIILGQVRLERPNTTFDGFTVRESAAGAGIVANNAAGDQIINNYITDNVFGLSLASDGSSQIRVQNNFFENNTRPGSASGNGIYTDFAVSDVLISANKFTGNPEGSVTFLGSVANPQSDVEISDNFIVNPLNIRNNGPIGIGNITGVTIRRNTISEAGDAIWIGGGVDGATIENNLIQNNDGAGVKFARPSSSGIAATSRNILIRGNSFSANVDGGILVDVREGTRYADAANGNVINASGNWWGSPDVPTVSVAVAPAGTINFRVNNPGDPAPPETVDFSPWLDSGANSVAMGAPGFLGNLTVLNVSPLSPKATADGFIAEAFTAPFNFTTRLQLFGGNYNDQAIINIPVAVVLKGDVTLTTGTATFENTVNGTTLGNESLTVNGNAVFGNGAGDFVGNTVPLEFINVSGTTALNAGNAGAATVRTTLAQDYNGAVTLGRDTSLSGSTIAFNNKVNGAANGTESLAISGNAVFGNGAGDFVGDLFALEFLDVSGTARFNAGSTVVDATVETTGLQTYGQGVTLGADTRLAGSTITFNDTVNGVANGTESLTIAGNAVFGNGAGDFVGDLFALELVDVSGTTRFNAGSTVADATVETTGLQTYGQGVTLGADTRLAGSTITFNGTVNGVANGTESLTIAGNGVFGNGAGDFVGDLFALELVDVSGTARFNAGSTVADASVETTGLQTYGQGVTLGADTRLTGSTITFNDAVNGVANGTEGLTIVGNAVFGNGAGDVVGNLFPLEFVDVSGTTALNGGFVTTAGAQDYDGTVVLGRDTTLTGSAITFGNSVDGTLAGNQSLNVVGNATFSGAVGSTRSLEFVDVTGSTALNGASVTTAGAQDYDGAVTLGLDTTLTGSAITFGNTVNGALAGNQSLSIVGSATFSAAVGSVRSLEFVDVTGNAALNGGAVMTTGRQDYDGAVTLGLNTILTGSPVTFGSTVNAAVAGNQSLSIVGNATFAGAVGSGMRLASVDVSGTTALNGGAVMTTGAQDYDGAVTLGLDTTLTGSAITFGNVVEGATPDNESLNIVGDAVFRGVVGNSRPLELLEVTGSTAVNGGSVTTAGAQNYNGAVTLGLDTALTGSAITFGSTLDGTTAGTESLSIAGDATFGGAVGVTRSLELIDVTGTTALNGGTVTTSGSQTYNGIVTLGANTILNNTTVSFGSTVNAANQDLTLNSSGDVTLAGPSFLNLRRFTTLSGGSTMIGGSLNAGTLIDIGDELRLGATGARLTAPDIALAEVSATGGSLTLIASLQTILNGRVTGVGALVTDAPGTTVISDTINAGSVTLNDLAALNGGSIITFADQDYNAAVTLGADTTLSGANVRLAGVDVTGVGIDLTINAATLTRLNGAVNGVNALTTDAPGRTEIHQTVNVGSITLNDPATLNGMTVTTTGDQDYNATVTLGTHTTLSGVNVRLAGVTGAGSDLQVDAGGLTRFNGTVNGVRALITDAAGNTVINGSVSADSVTLNDPAALNGGIITTVANQDYNAAVTLGADATLSGANVWFVAITGAGSDLNVNASGLTTFNGVVSGVDDLRTDAGGSTRINTASVSANSSIDIADQLDLGIGTTLAAPTLTLAGVTGNNRNLALNASGDTTLNGVVSGVGALTTDLGGRTRINTASVDANTSIGIADQLDLVVGTTLSAPVISLARVTGNNRNLTLNASGDTTLNGVVSGVGALATDLGGRTRINTASVSANTSIGIADQLDLGIGTTLAAPAVTLAGVTGNGRDLRLNASDASTFNGVVSGVGALSTDAGGNTVINQTISAASVTLDDTADLNGGSITTSAGQTYNAGVTLQSDNTLTTTTIDGGVTFGSTITGTGRRLDVNALGDLFLHGGVAIRELSITRARNINFDVMENEAVIGGPLTVNNLLFCADENAAFVNPDNVIANVDLNSAQWQASGPEGFVVVDSATAQFFTGTARGSAEATPFDASLQRLISSLVPQVQFQEIQAILGGEVSTKLEEQSGILTRSTRIHFKSTEALTRSGEVSTGTTGN